MTSFNISMRESRVASADDTHSIMSDLQSVVTDIMNNAFLETSSDNIDFIDEENDKSFDENNNEVEAEKKEPVITDSCPTTPQTNKIESVIAEIESPNYSHANETHNHSSIVEDIKNAIKTPEAHVKSPYSISQLTSGTPIFIEFAKSDFAKMKSPISTTDAKLGRIKLSIQYVADKSLLSVKIHEAKELVNVNKKDASDPYARITLLPDPNNKTKRKTKAIANTLAPKWDHSFEYDMTFAEAQTKTLRVNLKDYKGFLESQKTQFMGEILIKISDIDELKIGITKWFYLQPESKH